MMKTFLLLALLLLSLCSGVEARPYRIATVAWIGWSPLHVADELEFWEARGLEVEVVNYDDPIVIIEAIKAGKIDLAMDMAGSLVGIYMKGEPVLAIAETNWSHGGDKIIVQNGECLRDHVQGVIGVFLKQPSCLFFLDRYLQKMELRLSDFRIVEINSRDLSAQFIAGRLPAIVNYEPWASEALEKGNGNILATSADFKGCIPECLWGYREVIDSMPEEDIHNILRGWIQAAKWIKDPANREAYYAILRSRTFKMQSWVTDEDLKRMLESVAMHSISTLKQRNRDAGGLCTYFRELKLFLDKNKMLEENFSPLDIFENRFILHVLENEIE